MHARDVFGARFQNPIVLAAGTAGYGRELAGVMDLQRLGGIISKAVSLAPRAGNAPPRVAEYRGGMLNSIGLANPGLVAVRDEHLPWLVANAGPARVIVNVVGFETRRICRGHRRPRRHGRHHRVRTEPLVPQHQRRRHRVRR